MHHADPGTAVHERLAPRDGDIVVRKIRYGGLSTTDLDQRPRERGITTLVIAGVSTSGVVLLHRVLPTRAHILETTELHTLLRDD